jgi:hypothetical protein
MLLAAFGADKPAQLEAAKKAQPAIRTAAVNTFKLAPTGRTNFRVMHKHLVDKIIEKIEHSSCFLYI